MLFVRVRFISFSDIWFSSTLAVSLLSGAAFFYDILATSRSTAFIALDKVLNYSVYSVKRYVTGNAYFSDFALYRAFHGLITAKIFERR
jgi:hypothetical protein